MERMEFAARLRAVRERGPLVQCITNMVTVNDCANILLAAGASATMAHHPLEVADAVAGVQALVLNLGGIDYQEAMFIAGKEANRLRVPVVFDPVAAGFTSLRRETARRLLEEVQFAVIRGNASEIRALAQDKGGGSGVDVSAADAVTESGLPGAAELALALSRRTGAAVVLSGAVDVVAQGERVLFLRNGSPTMARITGSGCMLSALTGAFCGACPDKPFEAAAAAAAAMAIAGEEAERLRLRKGTGNATFRIDLIDSLFNLTEEQITQGVRYEIYQG
ncbi:hydroxyethylthiazole kinase [Pseudoflavonifractor phocaeensis]|uniref:hydroxyethylthiazole kinase n=1 Tax=Pseudoflavonifractor phocaeensis TaxID=1870988 RepID=UPI0019567E1A|nr:hydroxyethylthiazole kinase [Pseudoflavonifractor phocaeensis]MBM6925384.1 hydroxyethylthiazole kinase [Pseudoflavonifractor phocaeensis]